jgi:hypothetical protein
MRIAAVQARDAGSEREGHAAADLYEHDAELLDQHLEGVIASLVLASASTVAGDRVGRELTASFPAEREAVGEARRMAVSALRRWGCEPMLVHDAALVVSELASNAVIHAESPFLVSLTAPDVRSTPAATLRISVQDACPLTSARDGGLVTRAGHGLAVIEALSTRWGADRALDGKLVWAELQIH